ncbi:MAG: exodeoxyribonuclease VII small subunit [Clostridiales bacterium]|jgi:exodeoxyribonuclease VII small subunit|nr:exodeoxyribonuclease VII small subunit [Clostridiales bacterium]
MQFEEGIKKLEEIVKALESGDLTLEKSVELYSEGMKISADCKKELENAKLKVDEKGNA